MKGQGLVISGASGRFPKSPTIDQLAANLFNKRDFASVDASRGPIGIFGLPERSAKVADLHRFDNEYFHLSRDEADYLDPEIRLGLEVSVEALLDAGIDPELVRGTRCGVYVGMCYDNELLVGDDIYLKGINRQYTASRISHCLDLRGPAMAVDSACGASFTALQSAMADILFNQCDLAIVVGVGISLNLATQSGFRGLKMTSIDGRCKVWDKKANGYMSSECVSAIVVQRDVAAKRIYAHILTVTTNSDGYKEKGITFPSWENQRDVMIEAYREAGVNPLDIHYIEAHGTGTQAGDPTECRSIAEAMCKVPGRREPLAIGAHKSCIGHTLPASGLVGLTKALIAFETGLIPPDQNFSEVNQKCEAIADGTLSNVAQTISLKGDYCGINNFGFGGSNYHCLLKRHLKDKISNQDIWESAIETKLPRLICLNGRSLEAVNQLFTSLAADEHRLLDPEFLALLNEVNQGSSGGGMNARGYVIVLPPNSTGDKSVPRLGQISLMKSSLGMKSNGVRLSFSGLPIRSSSCLNNLMNDLATFPFAKESIKKSMDLMETNSSVPVSSIVQRTIVEIAIVDLLRGLKIEIKDAEGMSSGSLAAKYATGKLSRQEVIKEAGSWRHIDGTPKTGRDLDENANLGLEGPLVRLETSSFDDSPIEIHDTDIKYGLIKAFGQLYTQGVNVVVGKLYRQVAFPVSRGTPNLASLIQWRHDQNHLVLKYPEYCNPFRQSSIICCVNTAEPRHKYWTGHRIDGRVLLPAIGYLELVWQIEAQRLGCDMNRTRARFSRIRLHRATILSEGAEVKLRCAITPAGWEISDLTGSKVASGCIQVWRKDGRDCPTSVIGLSQTLGHIWPKNELIFQAADVYKLLRLRGYDYGPTFHGVQRVTSDGRRGELKWTGKWVSFADSMMHLALVSHPGHELALPVAIDLIECDPQRLIDWVDENGIFVPAEYDPASNKFATPGVMIKGMHVAIAPRKMWEPPCVERCSFYPFKEQNIIDSDLKASIDDYLKKLDKVRSLPQESEDIGVPKDLESYVKENSGAIALKILLEAKCGVPETEKEKDNKPEDEENDPKRNEIEGSSGDKTDTPAQEPEEVVKKDFSGRLLDRFNAHKAALMDDFIETPVSSERITRQLMDIAIEANLRLPMTIHEFTLASVPMHSQLTDSMLMNVDHLSGRPKTEYVVHHPRPEEISPIENQWIEPTIQKWSQYPSVLRGKLESQDKSETKDSKSAPAEGGQVTEGCDPDTLTMAVFRPTTIESLLNLAQSDWDLAKFLTSVYKALQIGGFALLVLKERLQTHELELIEALLKANGRQLPGDKFWMPLTDIQGWIKAAQDLGFSMVGLKTDSISSSAILLRKLSPESPNMENQRVFEIPETFIDREAHGLKDYEWVEDLKEAIKAIKESENAGQKLWLVSRGQRYTGLYGLFGELRREFGQKVRCFIDLREIKADSDLKRDPQFQEAVKLDLSTTVIDEKGRLGGYFFSEFTGPDRVESTEGAVTLEVRGDLSSFKWMELDSEKQSISNFDEVKCRIHYSALNFRDVMMASGRLAPPILTGDELKDNVLGFEFSGVDQHGEKIMGICAQMGLATSITIPDRRLLFKVPAHWTLEEAATVPLVYGTAYYAMITRGKINKGESILIHSATGGVGQAAVNLALDRGLTVFATVGNDEKRKFLLGQFPHIDPRNVASSRNLSFEKMIMRRTRGRGVDLVLNSLAGHMLQASVRCLAPQGRFLEIGKIDMALNEDLNLIQFDTRTFHGIGLDVFIYSGLHKKANIALPAEGMLELKSAFDLMMEDAHKGIVKPLNTTVFGADKIEDAFRFMATGGHTGKVLIQMRPEPLETAAQAPPVRRVQPRIAFNPKKSYVIVGGLGGLGIEMAGWMIERGVRHIVLTSRSGVKTAFQKYRLRQMQEDFGAKVITSQEPMLTYESAGKVLNAAKELGPLGGVFNLALILIDNFFEKQTAESFAKVNCKGIITRHLDRLTRDKSICPQVPDYFVCFSSASNRSGLAQPNYNYANSIVERICEMRRKDGLHGLAVQWGSIGDVGYVADREMTKDKVNLSVLRPQRIPSFVYHLEQFLLSRESLICSVIKNSLAAPTARNANALVKLCHLMGIKDPEKLNPKTTLGELGIDSLVAVEMRQLLEREYDILMSTEEIRKLTVEECRNLEKRPKTGQGSKRKAGDSKSNDQSKADPTKSDPTSLKTSIVYDMSQLLENIGRICVPLNDFDPSKIKEAIICFAGAEGTFEAFEGFGGKMAPRPVIGVNWVKELGELTSWDQICDHILRELEIIYPNLVTVNFVGHSFGVNVAFELARFAQLRGKTVRSLVFLDSSPALVHLAYNRVEEEDLPEVYKETTILMTFASMFLPSDSVSEIKQEMSLGDTADEQLHLVATLMRDQFSLSGRNYKLKDIKLAAGLYRHRARLALKVCREPRYSGDALLIKSSEWSSAQDRNNAKEDGLKVVEDYSVSCWITGRCTMLTMEGAHETIITNSLDRIAAAISEFIQSQSSQ